MKQKEKRKLEKLKLLLFQIENKLMEEKKNSLIYLETKDLLNKLTRDQFNVIHTLPHKKGLKKNLFKYKKYFARKKVSKQLTKIYLNIQHLNSKDES